MAQRLQIDVAPHSDGAPPAELRAKAVVRRATVKWTARDGVWEATIGRWVARVGACEAEGTMWEWCAFTGQNDRTRAVGSRGWSRPEQAQQDAESTLAELV